MPKYLPPPHKFRPKTLDSTDTVDFTRFQAHSESILWARELAVPGLQGEWFHEDWRILSYLHWRRPCRFVCLSSVKLHCPRAYLIIVSRHFLKQCPKCTKALLLLHNHCVKSNNETSDFSVYDDIWWNEWKIAKISMCIWSNNSLCLDY